MPGGVNGSRLVEVKLQSLIGKTFDTLNVEAAPWPGFLQLFVELIQLVFGFFFLLDGIQHIYSEVAVSLVGKLGGLYLLEVGEGFAVEVGFYRHLLRLLVDRLHGAGDVHHSHPLQLLEEGIGVAAHEDEIIFRHFSYHVLPPLLPCVCFSRFSAKPWRGSPRLPYIA